MRRGMPQRKDSLGYFIDLYLCVRIKFFEFHVKFEEFFTLDIPMEATGILVKNGIVRKQHVELFTKLLCFLGVEADVIGFHVLLGLMRWITRSYDLFVTFNSKWVHGLGGIVDPLTILETIPFWSVNSAHNTPAKWIVMNATK